MEIQDGKHNSTGSERLDLEGQSGYDEALGALPQCFMKLYFTHCASESPAACIVFLLLVTFSTICIVSLL